MILTGFWFSYGLMPDPEKVFAFLLIVASCFASGAAHGCVAFVLGLALFGWDFEPFEQPADDKPLPGRVYLFFVGFLYAGLSSGLLWGMLSGIPAAWSFYIFVRPVVQFSGMETPYGQMALGALAGLLMGLLLIRLGKRYFRSAPSIRLIWLYMLYHSNVLSLWQARMKQLNRV
jgi:hypothetical protein